MKKKMLAISVATIAAAGSAAAADLPRGPAPYYYPPAPSIYNWSGLYAGLNLGYEWGKVTSSSVDPAGVAGGGQLGYNWQTGQFVFGAETDIQVSAAVAVAIWVTAFAMPALALAPTGEPAFKPNQPTHSSEAPTRLSTRLCGAIGSWP